MGADKLIFHWINFVGWDGLALIGNRASKKKLWITFQKEENPPTTHLVGFYLITKSYSNVLILYKLMLTLSCTQVAFECGFSKLKEPPKKYTDPGESGGFHANFDGGDGVVKGSEERERNKSASCKNSDADEAFDASSPVNVGGA